MGLFLSSRFCSTGLCHCVSCRAHFWALLPGMLLVACSCPNSASQGIKTHFNIHLRQWERSPCFREESVRKRKKPVYSECSHINCQTVYHSQRSSTGQLIVSQIHIYYFLFFFWKHFFLLDHTAHGMWTSLTKDWTCAPVVEAQSVNPRTTREVHMCYFLIKYLHELFGSSLLLMFG